MASIFGKELSDIFHLTNSGETLIPENLVKTVRRGIYEIFSQVDDEPVRNAFIRFPTLEPVEIITTEQTRIFLTANGVEVVMNQSSFPFQKALDTGVFENDPELKSMANSDFVRYCEIALQDLTVQIQATLKGQRHNH